MASRISNFSPAPKLDDRQVLRETCSVGDHGSFVNALVEQFDGTWLPKGCPRCNWAALHTDPVESDSHKAAKARRSADRLNTALTASGITPRFRECTLESFETGSDPAKARAQSTCLNYVSNFEENYRAGRSLILSGNVGCGKTHLASAMAQAVIRQYGARAVIATIADIVRVAKGAMTKDAAYTEADVIAELAGADLLIVDEIGAQRGSDYEIGLLHEIIDRRYQLVVPTVVISNLLVDDLKAYIGERALDRLRQGGGKAVGFTWASARGQA